jgi:hypothetical protein
MSHMTVSKLLLLLLLLSSLLKINFILVYFSPRHVILANLDFKAIYPSTLSRKCKVLIVVVVVLLLLLLLLSLIT